MSVRILALLISFSLVASGAWGQSNEFYLKASVSLASGLEVRVEGSSVVVREGGDGVFRATPANWSPVTELAADVSDLRARAFSWNYPHLQDIAFVDIWAEVTDAGLPGLSLDTTEGFELRSRMVRPHDGMGGYESVMVDYWLRSGADGYLAVLRLGRSRIEERGDRVYTFETEARGETMHWPVAVIHAPSLGELHARIGQALLAYDGAGSREDSEDWWRIPALCGMCQQQRVTEVELDLQDRDSSLLLRVRTRVEDEDHARAVPEGMQIEGHALGPWLTGEQDEEAWFVVPLAEPLAEALMLVALSGDARVQARLTNGEAREVSTVRVQVDPAFQERLYAREKGEEEPDWPDHLSSHLVSTWPNPFRESTTIEVTVPGTIGEAFELEPELRSMVQLEAEPPFGPSPMVQVKVYNVSGQLVSVLDESPRSAGRFTVGWNGQDLQGRLVASGTYYVHVEMEEWSVTRRVLLLRN
jgi:hypothetical protein